jgi:SAM-dependent methyltransferase
MQDPDLTHQLPQKIVEQARCIVRRHSAIRSATYFGLNVARIVTDTPARNRRECLAAYETDVDPWGWGTRWGDEHLALVDDLLTTARPTGRFRRGLDFGCGEGWLTARMAPLCEEVVAVDLSPVALARARARCAGHTNVCFQRWDIQQGDALGAFDLVSAVCVLEVLLRPMPRRRARRELLKMLVPGGHLLVMTTKQSPVVEKAAWSGVLARGATGIDRFLTATGALTRVRRQESASHVLSLYRRLPDVGWVGRQPKES